MALVLSSALLTAAGFEHGFTTRAAGDFARGQLPPPRDALLLKQVHSTIVRTVGPNDSARSLDHEEGDALIGTRSGLTVGIRVADCIPALVVDPTLRHVAAVHAGWRGVAGHIFRESLLALADDAAQRVLVALGPAIGPCCFEVGADVAETIAGASSGACIVRCGDKLHVDLRLALQVQIERLGVDPARIEQVGGCTVCGTEGFHSFRRDGAASGRMVGYVTS